MSQTLYLSAFETFLPFFLVPQFPTHQFATEVVQGLHDSDMLCFPTFGILRQNIDSTDGNGNPTPGYIVDENILVCNRWCPQQDRMFAFKNNPVMVAVYPSGIKPEYDNIESYANPIIPCYYFWQVLIHCFSEFGYELRLDAFTNSEQFKKLYLLNTYNISKERVLNIDMPHYITSPTGNNDVNTNIFIVQDSTEINPANHLPDMLIADFLKDFMSHFNAVFVIKGKTVEIKYGDIGKVQREIKNIHPQTESVYKSENEQGTHIYYSLSDDSYTYFPNALTAEYNTQIAQVQPDGTTRSNGSDIELKLPPAIPRKYWLNFPLQKPRTGGGLCEYAFQDVPVLNGGVWGNEQVVKPVEMPIVLQTLCGLQPAKYNWAYLSTGSNGNLQGDWDKFEYKNSEDPADIAPKSIYALAFYYGIQDYGTVNNSWNGTGYSTTVKVPTSSSNNSVMGVQQADWDLGITTQGGMVARFYKTHLNLFNAAETINITSNEDLYTILAHNWSQSVLFYGVNLYIGSIKLSLPLNQPAVYECYRTD